MESVLNACSICNYTNNLIV